MTFDDFAFAYGQMPVDPEDVRMMCVRFAETYPTPEIREAMNDADACRVTWEATYAIFRQAMRRTLAVEHRRREEEQARHLAELKSYSDKELYQVAVRITASPGDYSAEFTAAAEAEMDRRIKGGAR